MLTFCDRLKELREDYGYTQDYVANELNVTRQTISAYENGTTEPTLANLIKLADLYNCSLDYLLCRTKEKTNLNVSNKDNKEFILKLIKLIDNYDVKNKK